MLIGDEYLPDVSEAELREMVAVIPGCKDTSQGTAHADGLDQYRIVFKVFRTLKSIRSIHIRDIHIRNLICKQERLNGGFADRFRYTRGINKEESLIFRIVIIHYNYIKPHSGIASRTPAEAAGIDIQGSDKWLTLIHLCNS